MLATLVVLALATTALPLEQLRTERRELARRPRGIIYNNDGCDALYYPKDKPLTVDSFLAARTSGVAGSQVGAIAYCTISSGFGFFTHATRAGQVLTRQSADYGLMPAYRNVTQELIELGGDCFQQVLTWGHANRTEVFWSMRMNDTHDVAHRPDKPYLLYPPLKEQHPEWLVGDWLKPTPHGRWSSVDYGRPEVRELAFRYLEEVCTNYDLDGVELDWLRHSCFFRSVAQGGKASDAERGAVTDLMRRVRAMTEEIGQRRGRPILVAIRVPDSVDYCRDLGLDLETWLSEGLADILITTCYFRLNPWSYTVGLARRHGVVAYPCLSDSRVQGETRFRRGSLEGYRGRAANAWAAGADGIHLFNLFNPAAPQFRELGSPAALRGKDKLFFVTYRDGDPADWLAGGEAYRTIPVLTPAHPLALQPQPCELEFEVGEEFGTGAPTVTLHLELPGLEQPARLRAALNEQPLSAVTASGDWLDFPVQAAWLRRGSNSLTLALAATAADAGRWRLTYDGAKLPAAPWARDPGSASTATRVSEGGLLVSDRGTTSGDYLYWRYSWGAEVGQPTGIEAKVKVVSGLNQVIFGDGQAAERLMLYPDRIQLWSNASQRFAMDTTDRWHTYLIETEAGRLRVYVDDELRLEAPYVPRGRPRNELAFGAGTSFDLGEAIWAALKARVTGQALRDACLSVRYPKTGDG